jgi:predicted TPR repeat methyltransferase
MQSPFKDELDVDPIVQAERMIESGQAAGAASLLRARIGAHRGGLLAHLALVRALTAAGEEEQALELARETARLNPGVAAAAVALGKALVGAGQLPSAIAEFQRALRIDPHLEAARAELGRAWLEAGEPDRALEAFSAVAPETVSDLGELVSRAESVRQQARSDVGYVRHLFDQFSTDYDRRMRSELGYVAPEILASLAALVLPGRSALSVLDIGCGTGLSGAAFKSIAARLDGVDLSPKMIARARARGIYDTLVVGDIESEADEGAPSYDLVLAADTLVYLGDLSCVMARAARRLVPGGHFLFTVEKDDGEGFSLGPKRRWRHSATFLRAEAEQAGFAVAGLLDCAPRRESGIAVQGYAVAFEKRK